MVLNLLVKALFSVFDLGKGSLLHSIPVFILVLIAVFLRKKILEKKELTWFKSSLIATFLVMLAVISFLYFTPILNSSLQADTETIPQVYAPTITESAMQLLGYIFKVIFVTLILTILLMPLEFVGVFVFEKLEESHPDLNYYIRLYLATLIMTIIASIAVLFAFPWIVRALLYFIFYA